MDGISWTSSWWSAGEFTTSEIWIALRMCVKFGRFKCPVAGGLKKRSSCTNMTCLSCAKVLGLRPKFTLSSMGRWQHGPLSSLFRDLQSYGCLDVHSGLFLWTVLPTYPYGSSLWQLGSDYYSNDYTLCAFGLQSVFVLRRTVYEDGSIFPNLGHMKRSLTNIP